MADPGLAGGAILCGYAVSTNELSVGDFVLFLAYIVQVAPILQAPPAPRSPPIFPQCLDSCTRR